MTAAEMLMDRQSQNTNGGQSVAHMYCLPHKVTRLENLGESVFYPAKHVFVDAGDNVDYCYVVKKGSVVAFETHLNGEERIYHLHNKNSIFLETHLLFGKPSSVSFKTTCATELIRIDKKKLKSAIKMDPQLVMDILEATSKKYHSSMEQVRHMNTHNASWKICDLFLSFAEQYGVLCDEKIVIQQKISQQFIASMLGLNRITTVRAVKELRELGLVEKVGKYYCINDIEKIVEYQQSLDKYA